MLPPLEKEAEKSDTDKDDFRLDMMFTGILIMAYSGRKGTKYQKALYEYLSTLRKVDPTVFGKRTMDEMYNLPLKDYAAFIMRVNSGTREFSSTWETARHTREQAARKIDATRLNLVDMLRNTSPSFASELSNFYTSKKERDRFKY